MDIQALKIELVKEILSSEKKDLLDKIYQALKGSDTDFWLELTPEEQEEVRIGREQINNGEVEEWDVVYSRLIKKQP